MQGSTSCSYLYPLHIHSAVIEYCCCYPRPALNALKPCCRVPKPNTCIYVSMHTHVHQHAGTWHFEVVAFLEDQAMSIFSKRWLSFCDSYVNHHNHMIIRFHCGSRTTAKLARSVFNICSRRATMLVCMNVSKLHCWSGGPYLGLMDPIKWYIM